MGIFIWSLNIQEEKKEEGREGVRHLQFALIILVSIAGSRYVAFITKSKIGKKRETNSILVYMHGGKSFHSMDGYEYIYIV